MTNKQSTLSTKPSKIPNKNADSSKKKPLLPLKKERMWHPSFSEACSIEPLNMQHPGIFNSTLLQDAARSIIHKGNMETGYIPIGGDANYGLVYIYLLRCYAAYIFGCDLWPGAASDIMSYNNYGIPAWLAIVFQNSLHFVDKKKGIDLRLLDPNIEAFILAVATSEGVAGTPVSIGTALGELVFGNGAALVYTSLTPTLARTIDRRIRSWFSEVVPICEISKSTSGIHQIAGQNSTGCLRPLSPWAAKFLLQYTSFRVEPHNYLQGDINVLDGIALFEDIPYNGGATLDYLCSYYGFDPWKITTRAFTFSSVRVSECVADLLLRNASILAGTPNVTAWNLSINVFAYFMTSLISKCHWPSRLRQNAGFAFYISSAMKNMNLFPALAASGLSPRKRGQCLMIPAWAYTSNNRAFAIRYQQTAVVAPDITPTIGGSVFSGTVDPLFLFANATPIPAGTAINCLPLLTLDELKNYCQQLSNVVVAQGTNINAAHPICPCLCNCVGVANTFVTGLGNMTYNWVTPANTLGLEYMDRASCRASETCCILDIANGSSALAMFISDQYDSTGNVSSRAVDAGFRDTNFENFAAAHNRMDPGESLMAFFRDRLLSVDVTKVDTITSKDLISLAGQAVEIGFSAVEKFSPTILQDTQAEWDLAHLVNTAATVLTTYGLAAFPQIMRTYRVRHEF